MSGDDERAIRRAAILGAVALAAAAAWGFYIFAGIAISGYRLGSDALMDALATLPPVTAGGLFLYSAFVAARRVRDPDWLTAAVGGALALVTGTLGVALVSYAVWAGTTVASAHVKRVAARRGPPATPITFGDRARRDSMLAATPGADNAIFPRLELMYACRGDWRRARITAPASGDPLPPGEDVCLTGIDVLGPCPACEQPLESSEPSGGLTAARRAIAAHREWLMRVDAAFTGPHRMRVRVQHAHLRARRADAAVARVWLYGYRAIYGRSGHLTERGPPRRDSLTVRLVAPYPTDDKNPIEQWIEVPYYTDAVYGLVVAPDAAAAHRLALARAIPPAVSGKQCHDSAQQIVASSTPAGWEVSVPPRECVCCAQ